jgi:uncharacterized protein
VVGASRRLSNFCPAKALRKELKWLLRDWSGLADDRARVETLIACHWPKALDGWTDLGFGEFELRYFRDKQKREMDFLVVNLGPARSEDE